MLLVTLLACPGPQGVNATEIRLSEVLLEVGTDPERIGPDATLRFEATLEQRTQRFGETETTILSTGPFIPVVVDEDGQAVVLVDAPDPSFSQPYNALPTPSERWRAEGGFEPGEYSVAWAAAANGETYPLEPPIGFVVQPTAQGPSAWRLGDTYLVQDYGLRGLEGILQGAGSSWIRVAEVDDERARLELIIESDYRCVAVNAWTDWSGDGGAWSQDSLSIEQDGVSLSGYGIFTSLPLSQDGEQILSGQAHMVLDMSAVDRLMGVHNAEWEMGESCALLPGFGIDCGSCLVGEPDRECLSLSLLDLNAARLSEQEAAALGADLPPCGLDLADIEAPVIDLSFLEDLNFDCGCTTAAGFSSMSLGWLAMALVRTRRRRRKGPVRSAEESRAPGGLV